MNFRESLRPQGGAGRNTAQRAVITILSAVFAVLIAGVSQVSAQTVSPLLDCVEYNPSTSEVTAYFGYYNRATTTANVPVGVNNVFSPPPGFREQVTEFAPGYVRRAFSVTFRADQTPTLTWTLLGEQVAAGNDPARYCSPPFTYQGRLTDGGAAANGQYDLRFELYAAAAGGTALETVALENVPVTNGTFTVNLTFSRNYLFDFSGRYLAIGVRPAVSKDAYTPLEPRQPLTNAPYATASVTALDAQRLGGFDLTRFALRGSNGNLTISGRITAGSGAPNGTNGFNFLSDAGTGIFNPTTGQLSLYTTNAERVRVTDSGVAIGAITPQQQLSVANGMNIDQNNLNSGTVTGTLRFGSSSGEAIGSKRTVGGNQFGLDFYTASTARMSISVGGLVSIFNLGAAGSTALCRNANNEIATCSSSLRYKTNIQPFASGLAFIDRLRPVSFDWRDGGSKDVGFGAEDVAAISPLFVNYNQNGQVEGVKYDRLSVVFVNAIKEQQTQIEQLEERVKKQERLIENLTRLVCAQNAQAEACR